MNPVWVGDVLVVGAGWSGLLAAKHCRENGLNTRILEKANHIGGVWKYREDEPGGVMANTQTTSSWAFTEISDFPLTAEEHSVCCRELDFPKHECILTYLEQYAAHNNMFDAISFNSSVIDVIKDEQNKFNVLTSDNKLYVSDKLVVCIGVLGNPRLKGFDHLTKKYTGEIRHANTYKKVGPDQWGKNILVIGGGETASDLCNEISYGAKDVYLSIPNGQWFGGRFNQHWDNATAWPIDNFSSRLRRTLLDGNPDPEKFEAMKVWIEKFDGKQGHGFKEWMSQYENYGQAIINKSNDILRRVVLGRVFPKGKIEKIKGKDVYFEDGTVAKDIDLIYFATGYRMEFPFLERLGKRIKCASTLYKLCLDTQDENLAFIGFARPIRGSLPSLSETCCRYVAKLWSKKIEMPPDYERERIRRLDKLKRDIFFTAFDKYGYTKKCPDTGGIAHSNSRSPGLVDLFSFSDELATLSGVMPNYSKLLFESGFKNWLMCLVAPYHQGQFLLNDPSKREYVFERYRYFLNKFPTTIFTPILFAIFYGWIHYIKAYIRNRFFWIIGYFFIERPHEGAVHYFELHADAAKKRAILNQVDALKDNWDPIVDCKGPCSY